MSDYLDLIDKQLETCLNEESGLDHSICTPQHHDGSVKGAKPGVT